MDDELVDQLERLARLRAAGVVTQHEFEVAKARLLRMDEGAPAAATTTPVHDPQAALDEALAADEAFAQRPPKAARRGPEAVVWGPGLSEGGTDASAPAWARAAGLSPEPVRPRASLVTAIVVALVGVVAVALVAVAVLRGDDDSGERIEDASPSSTTPMTMLVQPSDIDELLVAGGELFIPPSALPGDGWESGAIPEDVLPDCEAVGTIDPERTQFLVDRSSTLAVSIGITSDVPEVEDFGAAISECLGVGRDEAEPVELEGMLGAVLLDLTPTDDLTVALYLLERDEEVYLVSIIGGRVQVLASSDAVLQAVATGL